MALIYQQALKHTFEYKILHKINKKLTKKIEKDHLSIKENIFIGFSYGNYHGTNIFYSLKKNEKKARLLRNILNNYKVDIRCLSNMNMEYDLKVLLGYSTNSKEKKYIKSIVNQVIESFYKMYSICENGIYLQL